MIGGLPAKGSSKPHIRQPGTIVPGCVGGAMPAGDPCVVSLDLTEQAGVTTLVCTMKFASKEARDGAVSTGMTDGMEFSYTRLDDVFKQAA